MRGGFSSLLRCLTVALFGSRRFYFRPEQAEFPVAYQSVCDLLENPFRGRCATGGASTDALRRLKNSVNIEDQHEISFIRETLAPFARGLPPKGRSSSAPSGDARQSSQKDILAANSGIFRRQQDREKGGQFSPQWGEAAAAPA